MNIGLKPLGVLRISWNKWLNAYRKFKHWKARAKARTKAQARKKLTQPLPHAMALDALIYQLYDRDHQPYLS